MKTIGNFCKKYFLIIIISIISLVISISGVVVYKLFFDKGISLKEFSNSIYTLKYDTTWDLKEEKDSLSLKHKKGATINIDYIVLTNDFLYTSLESVIDEVSYSIQEENPNYSLLGKEKVYVTANKYEGYQLLYENGENEVLLTLFKKEDKIVSIVYEAEYEYFDILLDSAKEIIYNVDLVNKEYELSYNVSELELEDLTLTGNKSVKTEGTTTWKIANNHYLVEYTVPDNFKIFSYDSRYNNFTFRDDGKGWISINTKVANANVYEILDDLKKYDYDYSVGKAKEEKLLKKETYTQRKDGSYIYHAEYSNKDYNTEYDIVYLIYSLDKRRTFVAYIEGYEKSLDNSIVDNISIISSTKYADYVYRNVENGYLKNEFKFTYDSTNRKYYSLELLTPEEYFEYDDKFSNAYEVKKFRKKYDEDRMEYLVNIRYEMKKSKMDRNLESVEYLYSYPTTARKSLGIKTYNDKNFDTYYYEFNNKLGKVYSYVLYYEISDGIFFEIVIESIDSKIGSNDVTDLTKFSFASQEMK